MPHVATASSRQSSADARMNSASDGKHLKLAPPRNSSVRRKSETCVFSAFATGVPEESSTTVRQRANRCILFGSIVLLAKVEQPLEVLVLLVVVVLVLVVRCIGFLIVSIVILAKKIGFVGVVSR